MSIALIEERKSAVSKSNRLQRPRCAHKKRLSPRKLAANRRNSQKSTGPRTPNGKQNASQNSLKHGLCSQTPRLPNECSATYNIFVEELKESLHPTNPIQFHLFHQLTSILWRLQRTNDTEAQLYSLQQKHNDPPCLTLAKAFHKNPTSNPFLLYSRYERHLRNTYLRLLRELKNLQKQDAAAERDRPPEPAWSPEKMAAQLRSFGLQPNPDPDSDDFAAEQPAPRPAPDTKIAGTDWYKEMTDRWHERDKQRRLDRHRMENERLEQSTITPPSPIGTTDDSHGRQPVVHDAQNPAPSERKNFPLPVIVSASEPPLQTTNHQQPTSQNEPTENEQTANINPEPQSSQLPSPDNFDETNPPPPPQIANEKSQFENALTSPPNPVKIPAETTSMLNPRLLIALLFFFNFFLIAGCEKEESKADRRISENIDASREAYYKKDGGPEKSHKLLETAAKESTASAASRASAKELVGQSNYALAISRLPEVNSAENDSLRIIRELNRIGSELGDEVFLIDALKGSNPSASASDPLKALSANKAKFTAQVAELDKTLQQLDARRQELSTKINNLDTEQKSKVEMGNALMQKSDQAKGQESVDFFKQSAEVRQAAAILARDLGFARTDLKRTEQLFADTQAERKAAEDSVATAQTQITQLNQGWSATEDAIKKRRAEAAALVSRGQVDASLQKGINAESGIEALAKQFAASKQRAADARKNIDEANLEPAIAAYDEADKAGRRVVEEVKVNLRDNLDTPVRLAWQRMEKLANPISYRLGKARALQLRGQLFLREFNLLQAQQNLLAALQPVFQRGGLNMPQELASADLPAQLKTAHDNALRDLSDSAALLKDILEMDDVQRNTWSQANEARELSVTVEYALHHLDRDKGHLDSAKTTVKLLSDNGANFPALPPDLEIRTINPVPIVAGNPGPTTNPSAPGPNVSGPTGNGAWGKLLKKAGSAFKPGQAQEGAGGGAQQPPAQPNQ